LMAMFPLQANRMIEWLAKRLVPLRFRERLLGLAQRFLSGLVCLRSPRDSLMIFFTSVLIWLLETGKYWFVMHAFPFQVSFFTLMLINGIVNLATTIPSAPGYIGTFDAPGIAVLAAYGIDKAVAAGYILVLHVALWVPITALGAYYLAREGISWREGMEKIDDEGPRPQDGDGKVKVER
jgi:glycosyltransferase 2 family protein